MKVYTPDLNQTDKFINALYNEEDPTITIRYMKKGPGNNKVKTGPYKSLKVDIEYLNKNQFNIFLLVNPSYNEETKDAHVKKSFCYFIDIDQDDKKGAGSMPDYYTLLPSVIAEREDQKGYHLYWLLNKPLDLGSVDDRNAWQAVQQRHIKFYKSDPVIKNPARIMRLPGTYNWKPEVLKEYKRPLIYNIKEIKPLRYTRDQVVNSFQDKKKLRAAALGRIKTLKEKFNKTGKITNGNRNPFFIKAVGIFNDYDFTAETVLPELHALNKKYIEHPETDMEIKKLAGSIKYMSGEQGAVAAQKEIDRLKKLEEIKEALKDWYYIEIGNFFIDIKEVNVSFSKDNFNAKFSELTEQLNASGFCFRFGLVKFARQVVYEPEEEALIEKDNNLYINIWVGPGLLPVNKKPTWFIDHVKYLLAKPEEYNYLLDFLGHMVQHPREKIRHGLIIIGGQGIGKSILINICISLFGRNNVQKPSNDALSERFTKWAKECQVVFIDEIEQADKKQFVNKIKPYISEDIIEIREMFKEPYTINNYMSLIATTNDIHPVLLHSDDRRFMILKSDAKQKAKEYYTEFINKMETRAGEVLHYLQARDVSLFHAGARPPMTQAKADVINYSKNDLIAEIEDMIENERAPFDKPVVYVDAVKDHFVNDKHMARITRNRIIKVFKNLDLMYEPEIRVLADGGLRRFWVVRDFEKWQGYINKGEFKTRIEDIYKQDATKLYEIG